VNCVAGCRQALWQHRPHGHAESLNAPVYRGLDRARSTGAACAPVPNRHGRGRRHLWVDPKLRSEAHASDEIEIELTAEQIDALLSGKL
jgi:hypothetical protein